MKPIFKHMWRVFALVCAFGGALLPLPAHADWTQGETLRFRVYGFMGIPAGDAELRYLPNADGSYTIVGRAWTTGAVERMFPVRDRWVIDGLSDFYPTQITQHQKEGDYRAHKTFTYDRAAKTAYTSNLRNPAEGAKPLPLDPAARDMVSALYALRKSLDTLSPTHTPVMPLHQSTHPTKLSVHFHERTTRNTPMGRVNVVHVKPDARRLDGKTDRRAAKVDLWVTDDARRLPVELRIALRFGTFTAKLVDVGPATMPDTAPRELPLTGPIDVDATPQKPAKPPAHANPIQ